MEIDLSLSVLAIYAILALVVERIMEMFSENLWFRNNKVEIEDTKSRIADLQTMINELAKVFAKDKDTSPDSLVPLHSLQDKRRDKQIDLMPLRRNRAILFLGIGTAVGIVISFVFNFVLNIQLFSLFGLDITRVGDSIVSGLIIGAGTKPTHDLIGVIEKVVTK